MYSSRFAYDELRESWCFLTVESASQNGSPYITEWALGDGNPEQLLNTQVQEAQDPAEEKEILEVLADELDDRRYDDTTLITPARETLSLLRTRFVYVDTVPHPTFRGFQHIALRDLTNQYFEGEIDDSGQLPTLGALDTGVSSSPSPPASVERLWQIRKTIGPLVPAEDLRGRSL